MFRRKLRELDPPPDVKTDPNAFEIARIWGAHQGQHVSLNLIWDDPAAVGILIADLARHAANYYHQQHGYKKEDVIQRIKEMFAAELDSPTSPISGEVQDKPAYKTDD
jgi:hypothetical protein